MNLYLQTACLRTTMEKIHKACRLGVFRRTLYTSAIAVKSVPAGRVPLHPDINYFSLCVSLYPSKDTIKL